MLELPNRILVAIAIALVVPVPGCSKDEKPSEKSSKNDDDDDKSSKKKKSKGDDDDDDDKSSKKKKKNKDDDDEIAQKKKETEEDPPAKKKDDPAPPATASATAMPTATATATGTTPPATGDIENFAGTYQSNWGKSTFTQKDANITVVYPRGTMGCVAKGKTLYCRWNEKGTTGGAVLTKQANGNITGTWGNGASSSDGGPWTFTKS